MTRNEEDAAIKKAIAEFPAEFGLNNRSGKFRFRESASFFGGDAKHTMWLYVQCERNGEWLDYCREPPEVWKKLVIPL